VGGIFGSMISKYLVEEGRRRMLRIVTAAYLLATFLVLTLTL
jgi:hypothetical protein